LDILFKGVEMAVETSKTMLKSVEYKNASRRLRIAFICKHKVSRPPISKGPSTHEVVDAMSWKKCYCPCCVHALTAPMKVCLYFNAK